MRRCIAALGLLVATTLPLAAQTPTVAIVLSDKGDYVEEVRKGIEAGLAQEGYSAGDNLEVAVESVGGDAEAAQKVAEDVVAAEPAVVVPVTTPAARAVMAATDSLPIIFAAVPDPVSAGLVEDLMAPGGNTTGVTDLLPISEHFALIREILPQIATLGVLYNPEQDGSEALIATIHEFAPGAGVTIVEAEAREEGEVRGAAESLVGKVEAIYVPTDEVVSGGSLEDVIAVAEENELPFFSSDVDAVSKGAIAARSFNYYELGLQTGALVARILEGEKPGAIPVVGAEETNLIVNPGAAERMGVQLAPGFVALADEIIE